MGEIIFKRDKWCVLFEGRSFKFSELEEAEKTLEYLEKNGLPKR